MTKNSHTNNAQILSIQQAYDDRDWKNVIQLSSCIEPSSKDYIESRQLAAIAEYQQGSLEGAILFLDEVIDANHNNPNLYLNYANFMALSNQPKRAVIYFKKSIKLNPASAAAHNNLGSVLFDLKQLDESLECFQAATRINPNYWEALTSIGNVYFQQKQYRLSLDAYQQACQINSTDLGLLNNYALALMHYGDLKFSAKIFQTALLINPNDANLFIPLSAILQTMGNHKLAENILTSGIKAKPWYFNNSSNKNENKIPVISFSGLQNCLYDLDESNQVKLDGGHFFSKYLIDEDKFERCRYHIQNNNIETESSLPDIKLFINTISDPDLESESLNSLSKFLSTQTKFSMINHPDQVLLTTRDENYKRFKNVKGMLFPKTNRMFIEDFSHSVKAIINDYKFPVLIRLSGTQTGTSFEKIDNQDQLQQHLGLLKGKEIYVIEYFDTSFKDELNNSLFRRFRFFFIDGEMYPVTCHIHQSWNVHSIDRSSVMQQQNSLTSIEKDFLEEPSQVIGIDNYKVLSKLPEIVGLDFFGVDFSLTQDNQLVIFEVNAAMNHTYNYVDEFPYLKPYLEQISRAFHEMIESRVNSLK